jgi:hypothetical protein
MPMVRAFDADEQDAANVVVGLDGRGPMGASMTSHTVDDRTHSAAEHPRIGPAPAIRSGAADTVVIRVQ